MKKTSLLVALCIATVLVWANCGSDTTVVDTTKTIHFCEADTIVADTTVVTPAPAELI